MHTRDKGSGKSVHMLAGALSNLNSILKRLAQVFEMLRVTHYYEPLHVFRQLFFFVLFFFKLICLITFRNTIRVSSYLEPILYNLLGLVLVKIICKGYISAENKSKELAHAYVEVDEVIVHRPHARIQKKC